MEARKLANDAQKMFEKRNKIIMKGKNKINEVDISNNDKRENKVQKSNEVRNILLSIKPVSPQEKFRISENVD